MRVIQAFNTGNAIVPAGNVRTGDLLRLAPINSVVSNIKDLQNLPIRTRAGHPSGTGDRESRTQFRSFTNFSAANKEATLSRIFAGVHFRTDLTSGQRMGSEVADFVVDNFLTPVHGRDDSDDDRWFN
jgi:hypothetical protein